MTGAGIPAPATLIADSFFAYQFGQTSMSN